MIKLSPAHEAQAQDVAMYTPRGPIEGWRLGSIANGDDDNVMIYARALEIQAEWLRPDASRPVTIRVERYRLRGRTYEGWAYSYFVGDDPSVRQYGRSLVSLRAHLRQQFGRDVEIVQDWA